MERNNFCFCLFFLLIFCSSGIKGQNLNSDSSTIAIAQNHLTQQYLEAFGNNLHVFNGKEYVNYDKYYMQGHQFFNSNEEKEGDICYDNFWFRGVSMFYDIVLDQVILPEPDGSLLFRLENKKVSGFKHLGHTFTYLEPDSLGASGINAGFYDVLVDGNTQVLAKRIKLMNEQPTSRGMEGKFSEADKYFIRTGKTYYQVSKKKSILAHFPESKKELHKFIRSERLKFKKANREASIVQVVQYYNRLQPLPGGKLNSN